MDLLHAQFWTAIEDWDLSFEIGVSWWFPLLESIHVIAAALVVGAIFMVDLRMLGLAAKKYSIEKLSSELAPWSWFGFLIATVTGLGMFITRASSHVLNPAFQWKMGLLLLAGINMAIFHFLLRQRLSDNSNSNITNANTNTNTNTLNQSDLSVKVAGGLSLLLWTGVMLAGRWIGHIS